LLNAAAFGQYKICRTLLENGFEVNSGKKKPIHFAALRGFTDICRLLIEKGSEKSPIDNTGFTPLDNAIQYQF
jgi:ankyrin repeat protein